MLTTCHDYGKQGDCIGAQLAQGMQMSRVDESCLKGLRSMAKSANLCNQTVQNVKTAKLRDSCDCELGNKGKDHLPPRSGRVTHKTVVAISGIFDLTH